MQIELICNTNLYDRYEMQKKQMFERNRGQVSSGELTLWHGTGCESLNNIMVNGLNRSYNGKNGKLYKSDGIVSFK